MNRKLIGILTGAVLLAAAAPLAAQAATIQEALDYARSLGWPEDMIQQAENIYNENPELFPPEELDRQMAQLEEFKNDLVTNVPHDPTVTVPTTPAPDSPSADTITLTMPDGSTFTRISREQFIAMTYEEKMAYLSTFTPEQQTVFINDLSPEEYKSLMKQLPPDKKAEILGDMSAFTDSLGLTLSVDDISEDNLSFSMKNDKGELVSVGSVKETVENTGYDRRGILAAAGALVLAGIAGMMILTKKVFKEA